MADVVINVAGFGIAAWVGAGADGVALASAVSEEREDFEFLAFLVVMIVLTSFAIEARGPMVILMI